MRDQGLAGAAFAFRRGGLAVYGGFLGGYLAAGTSKSGKVATFGGIELPTVTMDGGATCTGILAQATFQNPTVDTNSVGATPQTLVSSGTGYLPGGPIHYPSLGALVSKELERPGAEMPGKRLRAVRTPEMWPAKRLLRSPSNSCMTRCAICWRRRARVSGTMPPAFKAAANLPWEAASNWAG